jgi:hypothetical protein
VNADLLRHAGHASVPWIRTGTSTARVRCQTVLVSEPDVMTNVYIRAASIRA